MSGYSMLDLCVLSAGSKQKLGTLTETMQSHLAMHDLADLGVRDLLCVKVEVDVLGSRP